MELESSSPYPQVPATCPYPEPPPSSPQDPLTTYHTLIKLWQFYYILEMIKGYKTVVCDTELPDNGLVRLDMCGSWHIKTLL
jgi:hypothetical protein